MKRVGATSDRPDLHAGEEETARGLGAASVLGYEVRGAGRELTADERGRGLRLRGGAAPLTSPARHPRARHRGALRRSLGQVPRSTCSGSTARGVSA
ncbi:hypothetical protein QJS66_06330 [Kocuria rhizophila]|nr:hypothetical protein QJS66_06330 [Kocuria rhizophila]